MTNRTVMGGLPALLVVLGLAPAAVAQLSSFRVIDYPGAILTWARGINDAGDVVGDYTMPDKTVHGYVLRAGRFTTIDFPGAAATIAQDVNRAGDIVGNYRDSGGKQHGFLLSGGRFTTIDFPGADNTGPAGVNNKGEIVGMYFSNTDTSRHRGFLLSGGRFSAIPEVPGSGAMSCALDINDDGKIVGHFNEGQGPTFRNRGYLLEKGMHIPFNLPVPVQYHPWDASWGINSAGDVVGIYTDVRWKQKGYLLSQGNFTPFDVPGSRFSRALRINDSGQVVGMYQDSDGVDHGFLTRIAPPSRAPVLTVDDDGADCPSALKTIQEAVAQAPPGTTIQVCPGIYFKSVTIAGPTKNGLKLIALGREDEVILQGDYTERDGFHLENVSNVLIRGFTVRDFGNKPTTETDWGAGNLIHLENADYNTIEHNRLVNGDMMGVMLVDSANNTVQHNTAFTDNANLANCGIHVQGAKSAGNTIRQNTTWANNVAGIMIRGAGPGNRVLDNTVLSNGRFGIDVQNTNQIWIEGNRVSYSQGFWGKTPGGKEGGLGIHLVSVDKALVFDNRVRSNTQIDIHWDGKGENQFEANACEKSTATIICGR